MTCLKMLLRIRFRRACRPRISFQRGFGEDSKRLDNPYPRMDLPDEMSLSETDKYLFDLNGYLVIRNVFSQSEVAEMNRVIDSKAGDFKSREDSELKNTKKGTPLYGGARKDLGGLLGWSGNDSFHFKKVLDHPTLRPYYHEFLGKGYRMDHFPFVIAQVALSHSLTLIKSRA